MAVANTVHVKCANKLCDYEGTATLINETVLKERRVCPKCGFKTLGQDILGHLSSEELGKIRNEVQQLIKGKNQ